MLTRKAPKRTRRNTGPPPETRELVARRADWTCELCQRHRAPFADWQYHHRQPRGMGGRRRAYVNQPSNLLLLCSDCHTTVESRRAEALDNGWLVSRWGVPAETPVLIDHGSRWVYLTDDGRYADAPAPVGYPELTP